MHAFTNVTYTKDQLLAQLRAHAAADEIVKGSYWEYGKGCAVGCCLHGSDHALFEPQCGIPWRVAWLADDLFECLPAAAAKVFAVQWIEAIPIGADLSRVYDAWCAWMLTDPTDGLCVITDEASVRAMGLLFRRAAAGDEPSEAEWNEAAWNAWNVSAAKAALAARFATAAWAALVARSARAAWAALAARSAWDAWAAWDATAALDATAAWDTWTQRAADVFVRLLAESAVTSAV